MSAHRKRRKLARPRSVRKFRPVRVVLVLVTAALSAGTLVAVHNVAYGTHLNAAKATPASSAPSCCRISALSNTASPWPDGWKPAPQRRAPTPAAHESSRTPAAHSSASPHQVQSASGLSSPSGVSMPTGNLPGWRLTYNQDFSGDALPSGWGAYSGEPGGDPNGNWDPANVSVGDGELHLTADNGSTGGVAFSGNAQQYGMYLVRMKSDYEPGLQISNILLLWPDSNVWPPEIDFYEDGGGSRSGFTATLHPGPDGDNCCTILRNAANAATQWHTYGVIWTPTSITYTIDGKPFGVVQSSELSDPASWPNIPMNLDLQSQNLGTAQPSGSIETMTVAWVAEYAQSS
jgi:hypothetical protein